MADAPEPEVPAGRRIVYKTALESSISDEAPVWPSLKADAALDAAAFYEKLENLLVAALKPIGDYHRALKASRPSKRSKGRKSSRSAASLSPAPVLSPTLEALQACIATGLIACTRALQLECSPSGHLPMFDRKTARLHGKPPILDTKDKRVKLRVKRAADILEDKEETGKEDRILRAILVCRDDLTSPSLYSHVPGLCSTVAAKRSSAKEPRALHLVALPASFEAVLGSALNLPRAAAMGLYTTKGDALQPIEALLTLVAENMSPVSPYQLISSLDDAAVYKQTKLKHIQTTAPILPPKALRQAPAKAISETNEA